MRRRGTTNRNARGNTQDRLARRRWLIKAYEAREEQSIYDSRGNYLGERSRPMRNRCRCYACGSVLHIHTVTVDRIVPGCRGGTYRRNNIRPACARCNSETGGAQRG